MDTTAGSYALVGSRPKEHAVVIEKLRDAGAIILAKTQLSELAFFKGKDLLSGWSALGGQAQSAYTLDDSPAGSSTGSAVGVSAGYAPISIGTDTTGSVILPATRAALYGLRVTNGIIPMDGVIPVSKTFDSIGLMSKNVQDLANLLDILVDSARTTVPSGSYGSELDRGWKKLRIGVLDPEKWFLPAFAARPNPGLQKQINDETRAAYDKIRKLAGKFHHVQFVSLDALDMPNGKGLFDLFEADFKSDFESYLSSLESSKVRSLKDVIDFNEAHHSLALTEGYSHQETLIVSLNNNMTHEEHQRLLTHIRRVSREEGIDRTLEKHNLDVILGPADCGFNLLVCGSVYPSATMPLSYADFNGRPFGVFAITKAHGEHLLLQVLKAWKDTFPPRKPPTGFSRH